MEWHRLYCICILCIFRVMVTQSVSYTYVHMEKEFMTLFRYYSSSFKWGKCPNWTRISIVCAIDWLSVCARDIEYVWKGSIECHGLTDRIGSGWWSPKQEILIRTISAYMYRRKGGHHRLVHRKPESRDGKGIPDIRNSWKLNKIEEHFYCNHIFKYKMV